MLARSSLGISFALVVLIVSACSGSDDGTSPGIGGATQVLISVMPSNIVAGQQFTPTIQAELRDAAGTVVTATNTPVSGSLVRGDSRA
jgi:hypothetical protein